MFPFRIGVFLPGRPAGVRILLDIKESVDFISTSLATLNKRKWTFLPFSVISHAAFNFLRISLNNHQSWVKWRRGNPPLELPSCVSYFKLLCSRKLTCFIIMNIIIPLSWNVNFIGKLAIQLFNQISKISKLARKRQILDAAASKFATN